MSTHQRPPRSTLPLIAATGYLLAGVLWIGFSDHLGGMLFTTAEGLARFQNWKGWAFVCGTAALIYGLLSAVQRRAGRTPHPRAASARSAPLAVWLACLVLATAIPMTAVLGLGVVRESGTALRDSHRMVDNTVHSARAEAQTFLAERSRLFAGLARRPSVAALDPARCDPLLPEMLALHEHLLQIATLDGSGRAVCASARPDAAGAGTFELARAIPGGSLRLTFSRQALHHLLRFPLPPGSVVLLVDRAGTVLADVRDAPRARPLQLDANQMATLAQFAGKPPAVWTGYDGERRIFKALRVEAEGWHVLAGIPAAGAYNPVYARALQSGALALAVLVAASLAVAWVTRRITGPIRALTDTARSVAEGDFDRRAPETGPAELAQVAAGFNHMLDRLPLAERRLRESEQKYRLLLDRISRNVPGMIFQLAMHPQHGSQFHFISRGVEALFGVSPEAAMADPAALFRFQHPDDVPMLRAAIAVSRRALVPLRVEHRVLLPGRGVRHHLIQGMPEGLPDGWTLWHGCTVDISEEKFAAEALQRSNETLEARIEARTAELERANRALESFSYSVAHDLRAPLSAIGGFAGALPAIVRRGDPARTEHLCERITANTARMTAMIDSLLSLAGVGRAELRLQPVDMTSMARQVAAEQPGADGAQIDIGALPSVPGDPAMLRQLWWNLVSNALKYSARKLRPRIEIRGEEQDGEAVFHVRDNGAGFDPALALRLFSPFQRLHAPGEFEGTGIGLAIARRVVERHGGRIWADAVPGEGAVFSFALPNQARQAARAGL